MADDQVEKPKPKKTTEKREIIGKVKGISDEGETLKIKLEESDGSSWEWKSFHASEWRGKVEFDKTYKVGVALVHEEGRRYPWRNLTKLIGPAEMPAPGEFTSRPAADTGGGASPRANSGGGSTGGGGKSMDQSILTRNSIEAGNAVNMVLELMKLGVKPDEMSAAIEDLTANADKIIDWMSGHWVELGSAIPPVAPATNGASKPAAKGNGAKAVEHPANIGEFLNTCMANWNMTKPAVEEILGEPVTAETDFAEALQRVGYAATGGETEAGAAA